MSAPITEAHLFTTAKVGKLYIVNEDTEAAQAIADSEARATAAIRAEVERLRSDRDCEKRLRKDADELREDAIARAERAEAELATERARLDWLLLDVVSRFDDAYYTRAAIDAGMREGAK